MRGRKKYRIEDNRKVKHKLLLWAQGFEVFCALDSNSTVQRSDRYSLFDCRVAVGAHSQLQGAGEDDFGRLMNYVDQKADWLFGYLSYDLKNQLEKLESGNPDFVLFPELHFFQPEIICDLRAGQLEFLFLKEVHSENSIDCVFHEIMSTTENAAGELHVTVQTRLSKKAYLHAVKRLKKHIAFGDIYELNFCQEFFASEARINPVLAFERLNGISSSPFAAFYKYGKHYLMSASPERFLCKRGTSLYSQPIKGTRGRGDTDEQDNINRKYLEVSEKDRCENVMIVDIVRNDLSRSASRGSVKVEELFGIYTFKQVHQLISTVSCELREGVHPVDAIRAAFPMGSMTGAPKIRAMQLIEDYEPVRRGLYSGAVGYFTPERDFDFNVVIRSILYNAQTQYLSFMAGGAITAMSDPEEEYAECLVKAKAMFQALHVKEPVI